MPEHPEPGGDDPPVLGPHAPAPWLGPGFAVEPDELESIAEQLRQAAGALDDGVAGVPAPPDAGPCTEAFALALAVVTEAVGKLAQGTGASGDNVEACKNNTLAADSESLGELPLVEPY